MVQAVSSIKEKMVEITEIRICGRNYKITDDEWQPLYIKKLAGMLENELKKVEEETGVVDNYKLLILSGLNILDKVLKLEDKKTGTNKFAEEEISSLNSKLGKILS